MHPKERLLSLERRRQKQLLCLMFIHKQRFSVARIHERLTRAAGIFSLVHERYNCIKYKHGPYYKGAILWDGLPLILKNSANLLVFKKHLEGIYRKFDNIIA